MEEAQVRCAPQSMRLDDLTKLALPGLFCTTGNSSSMTLRCDAQATPIRRRAPLFLTHDPSQGNSLSQTLLIGAEIRSPPKARSGFPDVLVDPDPKVLRFLQPAMI